MFGALLTVRLKSLVSCSVNASVARMRIETVPGAVGVPLKTPLALIEAHAGGVPCRLQLYGASPPEALI